MATGEIEIATGHAELPGDDGWFRCAPTGSVRLSLSGDREVLEPVLTAVRELLRRGVLQGFTLTFHDGPGEGSCAACNRELPADGQPTGELRRVV